MKWQIFPKRELSLIKRKKDIENKLDQIADVLDKNCTPLNNIVWNSALSIQKRLLEKQESLLNASFKIGRIGDDWVYMLETYGLKENDEECSTCFKEEVEHEPCQDEDREQCKEEFKQLTSEELSIKTILKGVEEEGNDFGLFFMKFGDKYPDNYVTRLALDECKDNFTEQTIQESKLDNVLSDKVKCEKKLLQIEENIKKGTCQCLQKN